MSRHRGVVVNVDSDFFLTVYILYFDIRDYVLPNVIVETARCSRSACDAAPGH